MTEPTDIVIVAARRTAMGGFQGDFKDTVASELGAAAVAAAVADAGLGDADVEQLMMGCVLPAGQGQAPARQVALKAGLDQATACTTVNKMCGSGMQAVMQAHDSLKAGAASIIMAGGMESMSNAPYLLPKARAGMRMGHGRVLDHMFLDGLEDAYQPGKAMGVFAEDCARHYQFTRGAQDEFALESLSRANAAIASGAFAAEITPVATCAGAIATDEQPGKARPDKIPGLKPAFVADGTVTAANASSISDGAAALVLMRRDTAQARGLKPLATIHGHAVHAQAPGWFTTAPVPAMRKLMDRLGWTVEGTDLFEVNEAFAVVTMAAMRELSIPHDRMNIRGGATALGHPIGASGARLLVTLIHSLSDRGGGRGIASLCIGGGEATAVAIAVD